MQKPIDHRLYFTWMSMKGRCQNVNHPSYKDYGGRGLTVCDRWKGKGGFANFISDMGDRPEGMSLERKDNNQGYSPDNCCWATRTEQQRNRRNSVQFLIGGKIYKLAELAEQTGLKPDTIKARHARGLSYDEIVSPLRTRNLDGLKIGGKANGERQKLKTHCPQGHEYTEANLEPYAWSKGWRRCKRCNADRQDVRNKAIAEARKILD